MVLSCRPCQLQIAPYFPVQLLQIQKLSVSRMAEFQLDIKDIQNQDAALTIAEVFLDTAVDEKGLRKDFVNAFFSSALNNLENQATSPKTKFYTLFVIKELSTKDKITLKVFGTFAQHPLYAYLEELAFTVDPKKPVSEKGKSLFPADKQTGNNFMRILLESLVSWGTRFPTNSKKEPTKFRRTLTRLQDEKVVIPKDLVYYPASKKSERAQTPQGPKETVPDPVSNKGVSNESISNAPSTPYVPSVPKPKDSKQKQFAEIKFMQNKIEALMGIVQDSQSVEELQREIQSYHIKFEKDMKKLEEIEGEVIENSDEQLMHLYFKVVEFFNEERILFKENVPRNQFDVYATGYGIAYERIFQQKKSPSKIQPSIDKKLSQAKVEIKPKSGLPPPKPTAERIKSQKSEAPNNQDSRLAEKENIKKKPSEKDGPARQNKGVERDNRLNNKNSAVETYFSKLEARSKQQANQGFGSIAKSLSKEKKATVVSRVKASNVINTLNKSKFTGGSTFSKSGVKGIFAAPPNPNVRAKSYEGELVLQNLQLERQFERIKKEQGVRRMKASLFKNKYILYEDECMQVGFKSTPVYQKVDKFTSMIDFELFFGNKTARTIDKFEVSFKGDKQSLIYTSPQVVDSVIYPESQVKLELLNIPKTYPFGLIVINASYQSADDARSFTALLPNSILQMTSYFKLEEDALGRIWAECPKVLKTDQFKLSHHFPPDQLSHFLPMLKERVPYGRFAEEGSTIDYELFCEVVIRENFEGVLKIVIRPDLSAILQAGVYASDEESLAGFRFLLQSLQAALREIEG